MWFLTLYNFIIIRNNLTNVITYYYYNNIITFILKLKFLKKFKNYIYIDKYLPALGIYDITLETLIVNIKYIGKVFRITKKKRIFILYLNYPGFNYLIWKNTRIKKKRRRKLIFFYFLTNSFIKYKLFFNLIRLRQLNTYTKRGVYNNIRIFYSRKRKINTNR